MTRRRLAIVGIVSTFLLVLAASIALGSTVLNSTPSAEAQGTVRSDMQARLLQLEQAIEGAGNNQAAADAAIDLALNTLYGGQRVLPSAGQLMDQTMQTDDEIATAEMRLALMLKSFASANPGNPAAGRAFDTAMLIEETNEVAAAVGAFTSKCAEGMDIFSTPDCAPLQPWLDEDLGREAQPTVAPTPRKLKPGFAVKLRSPFVPRWFYGWEEDVRVTEPIAPGECSVVFKETRGLMLKLRFDRIVVVTDPWVNVFNQPRGTSVPIWTLEWMPSEFGKQWNICNSGDATSPRITTNVTQRIVQDVPLKYFWRFYRRN